MEPHPPSAPHGARLLPPPQVTAVVTCKGRLEHLRQSLPALAAQPGLAVVLVDYGCPQHSGAWAERHHPQAQVVLGPSDGEFSISKARNLGAAQAVTPWLVFMDADVVAGPAFIADLTAHLQDAAYLRPDPCPHELSGLVACRRDDFRRAGGYDEVFRGWGSEDRDLCARLERLGCRPRSFPSASLSALPHDDALRTRFHAIPDRFLSLRINGMYFQIKNDLARLSGLVDLPLRDRETLYAQVRAQVLREPDQACQIDAQLPARCDFLQPPDWRLRRVIRYRFEPLTPPAP